MFEGFGLGGFIASIFSGLFGRSGTTPIGDLIRSAAAQQSETAPALPGPPERPQSLPRNPFETPSIFGPGSNDPIFQRPPRIPGIVGVGVILADALDVLVRTLERRQIEKISDILTEQEKEIAEINRRALEDRRAAELELRVEKQVQALLNAPEIPEQPTVPRPIEQPQPEIIFDSPPGIFPSQVPIEIDLPGFGRDPMEFPDIPVPTVPEVRPAPQPKPEIRTQPLPEPLPRSQPKPKPFIGDNIPLPAPGPTLGPQLRTGFLELPQQRLQPQPETNPDEKCRRKCDDKEQRTQCFKGLYRETTNAIDFTEWTQVDCRTGKEVPGTGVAGSLVSNVVELF